MKRILCKLFKKRYATGGTIKRRLYITKEDYDRVYTAIEKEYEEAKARQKSDCAEPSRYMQGLIFALAELETVTIVEVRRGE